MPKIEISALLLLITLQQSACVEGVAPPPPTELVTIPGGSFIMGGETECTEAGKTICNPSSQPPRNVTMPPFQIDRHEVSNIQYRHCVRKGACADDASKMVGVEEYHRDEAYNNFPVVNIPWASAAAYCAFMGRRLPTEAEWEYAARSTKSGTHHSTPRRFPWGNTEPDCTMAIYANCTSTGLPEPKGAATADQSDHGVHDLAGNVAEWVADSYEEFGYCKDGQSLLEVCQGDKSCAEQTCTQQEEITPSGCVRTCSSDTTPFCLIDNGSYSNPTGGPATATERVVRGGSYSEGPCAMVSTFRRAFHPTEKIPFVGFRCAVNASVQIDAGTPIYFDGPVEIGANDGAQIDAPADGATDAPTDGQPDQAAVDAASDTAMPFDLPILDTGIDALPPIDATPHDATFDSVPVYPGAQVSVSSPVGTQEFLGFAYHAGFGYVATHLLNGQWAVLKIDLATQLPVAGWPKLFDNFYGEPQDLEVDPTNGDIWVASSSQTMVSVNNAQLSELGAFSLPVVVGKSGESPGGLTVGGGYVYVVNKPGDTIYKISSSTYQLDSSWPIPNVNTVLAEGSTKLDLHDGKLYYVGKNVDGVSVMTTSGSTAAKIKYIAPPPLHGIAIQVISEQEIWINSGATINKIDYSGAVLNHWPIATPSNFGYIGIMVDGPSIHVFDNNAFQLLRFTETP